MRRSLALAAVVLLALCPRALAEEGGEEITGPIPGRADEDTVFLRRIVEAATGKPAAGAVVKLFCEVPHPEPGFGTPAATATSGADGWVRVRKGDVDAEVTKVYGAPSWVYVEAAGLRPDAEHGDFLREDPDWPLGPSTTIRVALRDPLDRPVAGALDGWQLGCGHTPDVRHARTGPDGVATIEGAAADRHNFGQVWPVAPGLASRYLTVEAWAPWERPTVARLSWGPVIEGIVLSAEGKPAAGIGVGAPQCHRGPWTRTDAQGRFRLVGADADGYDLLVESGEYPVGPKQLSAIGLVSLSVDRPPPGRPVVVRLPAPGAEEAEEDETTWASVRLVVEVGREEWLEAPEAAAYVMAVRRDDGWRDEVSVGAQGVALLTVHPGTYDVLVFGRREGGVTFSQAQAQVEVSASGGAYVFVALQAAALVRLIAAPAPDRECELIAEGESEPMEFNPAGETRDIWVPVDRPVFLRVSQGGRSRLIPLEGAAVFAEGKPPQVIRVPAFEPVEVRARLVDPDGKPVPGSLSELEDDAPDRAEVPDLPASESPTVTVLSGERIALVVWPHDERRFQPSIVDVPAVAAGKPLDLGAIRVTPRVPELRLETAAGKPQPQTSVLVTRGGRAQESWTDEGDLTLVVDPWYAPGLVAEGALVRVPAWERHGSGPAALHTVPFVRRLEGPGPWTVRPPVGSISVAPRRSDDGELGTWVVFLDGRRFAADRATLMLTQVDDGSHDLVVDSPGTIPQRLRFTLSDGKPFSWAPRLRPEPPR